VCEDVNWINMDQDWVPLVGSCEYCTEPSESIKGGKFLY